MESDETPAYRNTRKAWGGNPITLRDALTIAGLCTGLFGGTVIFSIRSIAREEIQIHNNDSRAHPAAMEPMREHISRQNGEAPQNAEMFERIRRIEIRAEEFRETLARIEERMIRDVPRKK